MPAGDDDKKYVVLFDTSKKEMLNPNQGYKKIVQKLKSRYKCDINKSELQLKKMRDCNLLLLGGPRMPFNANELQQIRQYIEEGGRCMIMMNEGGE
jgi:intraflagellar transport protein 52